MYNQIGQNLSLTINDLPANEIEEINKDLQRENVWVNKDTTDLLDPWCGFFFAHGRFPGSQELIMFPQAGIPRFVNSNTTRSPRDLYENFEATDAKALVSIQALAALNIYYGGNRQISKDALSEFLHNLTFQAFSKKNDDILMQFDNIGNLVLEILQGLLNKDRETVEITKMMNDNIKKDLNKTKFIFDEPTETQMQIDMEKYIKKEKKNPTSPPPYSNSIPPLTEEELKKIYEKERQDYLKTPITISKPELYAATENADTKN